MKTKLIEPFGVAVESVHEQDSVDALNIETIRELFREHQLVLLRGFKPFASNAEFTEFCERLGEISLWPFGKILELVEHEKPADHIFDNNYVPMHWDGMYRPQVPEYQVFRCVSAPLLGQGGRTTFSNTISMLEHASDSDRELWSKALGSYQRKMEFYSSKTVSPIVTEHPFRGYPVIRYNEPPSNETGEFLNPPDLEFSGIAPGELSRLHSSLKTALYSSTNFYAHEWQTGDLVIADNFSLLHGREKFTSGAPRHLQRIHVLSNPPLDNPALQSHE